MLWHPLPWGGSGWRRFSGNCPDARSCPGMRHVSRRWCPMAETPSDTTQAHHGHETRDVDIRFIGLFSFSMVVLLAGSLALMGWLFGIFAGKSLGRGRLAPIAETRPYPPAPRLQASPTRDMQEMRRLENIILQSYGWVDQAAG